MNDFTELKQERADLSKEIKRIREKLEVKNPPADLESAMLAMIKARKRVSVLISGILLRRTNKKKNAMARQKRRLTALSKRDRAIEVKRIEAAQKQAETEAARAAHDEWNTPDNVWARALNGRLFQDYVPSGRKVWVRKDSLC